MTARSHREVRVFPDLETLSRAAADMCVLLADQSMNRQGRFTLALSGGSTPRRLYSLFAAPPYREILPWPGFHLFWCDERSVPPDRPESNYGLAAETFLSRVPLSAEQIHRIRGEEDPARAALDYERELIRFFGPAGPEFDLVLLGAGEDGHTASLFPGSPVLMEQTRLVAPVHPRPSGLDRVTLTLPVLNRAVHTVFLVSGHAKSRIVHEIIEDGNPKECPAGLVRPVTGSVVWMLDQAAAASLTTFVPETGRGPK